MISLLYVDDEQGLLEICQMFLEQDGDFSVTTHESAKKGLEALTTDTFDAIISDYQMPMMDGITFLKEVRSRFGEIPFILFTGRGREEIVIEAINNGADFYLQKGGDPVAQFAELAHKIRQAIGRRQAELSRNKAESQLRESEEKYRTLLDIAPLAVLVHQKGTIVYVNPECVRLSGAESAADLIGKDMFRFIHKEDLPLVQEHLRLLDRGSSIPPTEIRILDIDGQPIPIEVAGKYLLYGGVPSVIVVCRDITERKKAEDNLRSAYEQITLSEEELRDQFTELERGEKLVRESREILRKFMDSATDAFSIWDGNLALVDLNVAALAYHPAGVKKEDLVGRNLAEFVFGDGEWGSIDRYRKVVETGVPFVGTGKITNSPQGKRWLNIRCFRVGDGLGIATSDITREKEAEDALRKSEQNYRNLVENSQSIIYTLQPDGTFSFVSPSWKTSLGHDCEEVLGRNFREFVHPEDIPVCEAFLKKAVTTGLMQKGENFYRILHKEGTIHWHRSSIMPVLDEKGTILSIVGNAVDLTDRKVAEDALRESEAEMSSILHGSPVLQFVIGRDHRVLAWNHAIAQYSRIPSEEILGTDEHWRAFYPQKRPLLADLLIDNNADALATWYAGKLQPSRIVEGAYEVTDFFPAMGPSGTWLTFTAAPIRDVKGDIMGAVETLTDVTDRIRATEALQKNEEMYRHILETMQDAYIRTDEKGIIRMVNPAAVCMYRYGSPEEMVGIPASALYAGGEEGRERVLKKIKDAGTVTDFSGSGLRKDGTTFGASLNVQVIRDKEGRILGTEGIVRDISERSTMERAVQEANRKLNLLNSITRHDIVNQLALVQGYAQAAAMKGQDPAVAPFLDRILDGTATIHRQIEFMKTYQDLGVRTPGWFRLNEVLARAAKDAAITFCTCTNAEIFADPMLEKVFFNLFENARRHGEHVTAIHVGCEISDDALTITVEDNGIGIPDNEKEKIFRKGSGKHTGLGLFLAREILSITGITIRENGTPGKGARFEITVPKGHFRSEEQAA